MTPESPKPPLPSPVRVLGVVPLLKDVSSERSYLPELAELELAA